MMSDFAKPITYEDVVAFFGRARNPEKGKPLMSWARIKKVGDTYEVHGCGVRICVITPDNKLTFTMTANHARAASITLSQALHRALPFYWERKATGRYELIPMAEYHAWKKRNPDSYYWRYIAGLKDSDQGVEVFDGLEYDLTTNKFTNARPKLKNATVNQANKLEWLRKLRKLKAAVKVRARVGVLESLMRQVEEERKGINKYQWEQPDWSSDTWQDLLYTAVKTEDCSTDLLKAFIKTASVGYWSKSVNINDVINAVDSVFRTYSLDLRRKFGVFEYEQPA
jgi:hypothetical protein